MNALYKKLFGGPLAAAAPKVPAGHRVYAVGDVHGRVDLLDQLLVRIEEDIKSRRRAKTLIIFLGDLIDRGPASAQVVERLRTYRRPGVRLAHLCGNHEEVLLRVLNGDPTYLHDWLRFGGAECVESYGLSAEALKQMTPVDALKAVQGAIPREHQTFLRSLADTFTVGDYVFVHAGVRPGVALAEQSQADLRWIRDPFLACEDPHGFVVVHGHTISEAVEIRCNRIGVDTGAYRTGVLTALGLEGNQHWILQTGSDRSGGSDARGES